MSSGLAPFGSLPQLAGLSQDDLARIFAQFGQGQPQGAPVGGPLPDPQTTGSLGGPPVAMSEADTRRLEQQTGMVPSGYGAPQGSPDLARLFDPTGMGGGLGGFGGSSGQVVPGARMVPSPPQRPDDLSAPDPGATGTLARTVAAPGEPPRGGRPPASGTPSFSSAPTDAAMARGGDFDPLTGQPLSGNVTPARLPASPMSAFLDRTGIQPAGETQPSFGDRLIGAINGNGGLLTRMGLSLMSTRGFGNALKEGYEGHQRDQQQQAAQSLAGQKAAIERYKFGREIAGQNFTVGILVKQGYPQAQAEAIVASAAGGNTTALNNALANAVPRMPDAPSGYRRTAAGDYESIAGGPADAAVLERNARAVATDREQTPLTDPAARLAAGVPVYDVRPAWRDPNGKVTFDDGPKPQLNTTRNPDGSSTTREYDPATRTFREVPGGGAAGVDTAGVPPGVDPLTYRREAAKAAVAAAKAADQRSLQAQGAIPILDRATSAYERLALNKGIGPISASQPNRIAAGAFGRQNEIDRQDFEAAAKQLELLQAQIQMKGQGAITEGERRILAMTLPRLDAASPETGLTTLRGMRDQFGRAISAPGLSASAARDQGQPGAAGPVPSAAAQALQQDPSLAAQFDAKYGRGAASRILGGR